MMSGLHNLFPSWLFSHDGDRSVGRHRSEGEFMRQPTDTDRQGAGNEEAIPLATGGR